MRVLHIAKYFPPYAGGMENYLRDLMAALSGRGIDNAALVHQSQITFRSAPERYHFGNARLRIMRTAVWARLLFTPISPTFPWLLNCMIRQQQPEILHLHLPNVSAFWVLLLPQARKVPWVVHWHSDVLPSEHSLGLRCFYRFYRPFERALLRRSKAVIATSPPYLESSGVLYEFRNKCRVIPLGLDPSALASASVEPSAPRSGEEMSVLAIGRLTYYKGFEYLIRALAETRHVRLELVGQGEQEERLKNLSQTLGLDSRIRFHGHLSAEQLAQQYARCDCVCLPSVERTEAFGMVLLEAMYFHKATLVCDVPGSGMGWVVDEGKTGRKVPPKNVQELASALQNMQQDRAMLRTLGEQGWQKFSQQFHIHPSAKAVSELYQDVLGHH